MSMPLPSPGRTLRRRARRAERSARLRRTPLTAPRRATPAWSPRAACERRPLRRVGPSRH